MIGLFKDINLKLPITDSSPKKFLVSVHGGIKITTIYLGDPTSGSAMVAALAGDTTLTLDNINGFPDPSIASTTAKAIINGTTFTYTGIVGKILQGVVNLPVVHINDVCRPADPWNSTTVGANIQAFPYGTDLNRGISIALAMGSQDFGLPGTPAFLGSLGVLPIAPIAIRVEVITKSGDNIEFLNWGINVSPLQRNTYDGAIAPVAACYMYRGSQGPPFTTRILATNREVLDNMPGFIVGSYKWRDENTRNATAFLPTRWDQDVNSIGVEKFVAGIGDNDDLQPIEVTSAANSLYLNINHGHYFTGVRGYYLPSIPHLEFIPGSVLSYTLPSKPRAQKPIFVGTWRLDGQGFYETATEYRYVSSLNNPDSSARTDLPANYFTINRVTSTITINKILPDVVLFTGVLSGNPVDYFDLPVYPINQISSVYIDQGNNVKIYASNFAFDKDQGTLQVTLPVGASPGQAVYVVCTSALAVLYEEEGTSERTLTTADLNPAFSGVSAGYVYLQHRRQKPASITLSCDKPRITIPATLASIVGMVAYGPVYYDGDYALLQGKAYGLIPGEIVPNATLQVVVNASNWVGLINYMDPINTEINVVTGADGIANLVYTPPPSTGSGIWIPTTNAVTPLTTNSHSGLYTTIITNDSLVLPTTVPIGQIWNILDGWLINAYSVYNNDPLLGSLGGDSAYGEVAWTTVGTPGAVGYQTNGAREMWKTVTSIGILPINAYDVNGNACLHPDGTVNSSFTGSVKYIQYAAAAPVKATIGAYFLTYKQRVTIQLKLKDSNVISNSIMLQCAASEETVDLSWLRVQGNYPAGTFVSVSDAVFGRINQYRLGWVRPTIPGV